MGLPFQKSNNEDVIAHGFKPIGGLFPDNSIGWYRKQFIVDKKDSGQRFVLDFDGIFRDSRVWVNGIYCGGHWSGYTGSSYDITDFISFTKPNVITVRVDATQYEGWFYEGAGIYRHVWLNEYNNLHLVRNGGVYIHSDVSSNAAQISIEAEIENKDEQNKTCTIQSYITTNAGKKLVASSPANVITNAGISSKTIQIITLQKPHLWTVDDPY